jgi:hypothetical protein
MNTREKVQLAILKYFLKLLSEMFTILIAHMTSYKFDAIIVT